MRSLWGSPLKRCKQRCWHYVAGQLRVWQNYFHGGRNIHNWPSRRGEGAREQLAAECADAHGSWLLSECERPDCSPEPGGQRRSRLLSPAERASKTMWQAARARTCVRVCPTSLKIYIYKFIATEFCCVLTQKKRRTSVQRIIIINDTFDRILSWWPPPPRTSGVLTACRLIEIWCRCWHLPPQLSPLHCL